MLPDIFDTLLQITVFILNASMKWMSGKMFNHVFTFRKIKPPTG